MIEPIFTPLNRAALAGINETDPVAMMLARDRALLHRAVNLAIESAFSHSKDVPVGAVAAAGDSVVGRYFASDKRLGYGYAHAENMAVTDARVGNINLGTPMPDTVVVTLEPCNNCQDFLATIPSIKRVGFGLPRSAAEERGILKRHHETIFQRALRVGLPYEIVQIDDPALNEVGGIILDHMSRDPQIESLTIDVCGLQQSLVALQQ